MKNILNFFKKNKTNGLESFKNAKVIQSTSKNTGKKLKLLGISLAVVATTQVNLDNSQDEVFADLVLDNEASYAQADNNLLPQINDTDWSKVELIKSIVVKNDNTDAEFEALKKEVKFRKNTSTVRKQLKPQLKR